MTKDLRAPLGIHEDDLAQRRDVVDDHALEERLARRDDARVILAPRLIEFVVGECLEMEGGGVVERVIGDWAFFRGGGLSGEGAFEVGNLGQTL